MGDIKEEYKTLLDRYYIRDESSKKEYQDFVEENGSGRLQELFDYFPHIEKDYNLKLPRMYKNFIEAKVAWGVDGINNSFRLLEKTNSLFFIYCDIIIIDRSVDYGHIRHI